MIRQTFNQDWNAGPHTSFTNMRPGETVPVTLPHDMTITKERDPQAVSSEKKGYYPDGTYDYTKKFVVPADYKEKRVTFEFEGVYSNAMVYINDDYAGQHPYGYSNFYIKADRFLKYGEENEIKVVTRSYDDSRWYTGTGIYRNTKIIVANPVHIAMDGIKISTPDISSGRAVVTVATAVENEGMNVQATRILTEILDSVGLVVASDSAPLTAFAGETVTSRQRMVVREPKLWDVDSPSLYTCRIKLMDGDQVLDEEETTFGIRSLSLDAVDGLRINGEVVKLRGACVHHDNGVIGAATIDRAEERRVEILKEAGFNAIRSSHYPMSKAMLQACDRIGMLVMDESFDVWTTNKSAYDYSLSFPLWWEKDIEAMVHKNYNHPSVIMYSIGNEVPEAGSPHGAAWGRKLAEKVRSLDHTRYVINSVNGLLSVIKQIMALSQGKMDGNFNNTLGGSAADMMKLVNKSELVTNATSESFAAVDVAGYNYADSRYEMDKELFPNRIICGSETFPKDIADNWKLVKENGHVIGDFTWTGWDYLGESGIGKISYEEETSNRHGMFGEYPWLTAYCGDIDIIGNRRPASYYREIVFGLRNEPYIAVLRPAHYGEKVNTSSWGWSDSVSSWSWDGYEAKPVQVEVYSAADEVELLVNGEVVGKVGAGEANKFKAEFETVYISGEIVAVAYTDGQETGRTVLKSAGNTEKLLVEVDRSEIEASDRDLTFITVTIADENGILKPLADRNVTVTVEGSGVLQGFGSANPKLEGNFFDSTQKTYDGKVLAVIRPTSSGIIHVSFNAEGCTKQTVQITVRT
ncbi:glycoside hydrolase family 2 TIM barrel-domain containing protein [Paenibacillus sinopodophylli]|uniref:glycoside hydrolase family 2 TIM barrel-domain containing protein n=1 Tax=Paenibacillus sinopodophylli TaxID=1837342 RepID=UPI00110CF5D6|nr:glycoside hydrolase family 2 TIM barrel-domain containing protein [Paenibacillus sinopodophylli]